MTDRIKELREHMLQQSTEDLVRIVTEEAGEYAEDALDIARAELRRRGVYLPAPSEMEEAGEAEIASAFKDRDKTCRDCGGKLRYASLQASGVEVTLAFVDAPETRFLEVDVCLKCRKVTLRADLETEI